MLKIFSLILLNIKQGVREKIFWIVSFIFLLLLVFSLFLGELSIMERDIVLRNMGLSSIEISGLILIVFSLTYNFFREKDSRLKEVYLSYFYHLNYLAGKLIGYIFILFIYILLATILVSIILFLKKSFHWYVFLGSLSILLKLSIFSGLCLFFCSLFGYPILAIISTIFTYVTSEFSYDALKIVSASKSEFIRLFFRFLYHILPNADKVDLKYQAIHLESISIGFLMSIILYVFIYILLTFFLSTLVFLRKEH